MDWGMKNRLSQVIGSDGHCFFMPIDHGYFQGPTRCLEKPAETIKPLLPYYDALFVTRGVLRSVIDAANTKPIILRVSGGTSMVGRDLANEGLTTSIEEIIRLKQKLNEIVSKHTGQPVSKIEKDSDRDYFMSAQEAQTYGLVDEVIESLKETNSQTPTETK